MTPQELETLHAYQRNQLDASERLNLEEKLRSDPHWQQLWGDFQLLTMGIQATGQLRVRQEIQAAGTRYKLLQQKKRRTLRWSLGIAATLVLGLSIGGSMVQRQHQKLLRVEQTYHQDTRKLLNQALDALEMQGFAKPNNPDSLLLKGLLALENQELETAVDFLTRTATRKPDAVAQFFLGKAYQEQQKNKLAIQTWKKMPTDAPTWVKQATRYELSCAYAKSYWQQQRAKKIWREIAQDATDPYQESARLMLQQLEK